MTRRTVLSGFVAATAAHCAPGSSTGASGARASTGSSGSSVAGARTEPLIGTCTWTLGIEDLDEMMDFIVAADLTAVQYCQSPDLHPAEAVRAAAEARGLPILAYDPFDCRPPSDAEATREAALAKYMGFLDYAAALGTSLTIHGLTTWTVNAPDDEAKWALLADLVRTLVAAADERGVQTHLEPCNIYEIPLVHTAADFERVAEMAGTGNLKVLLDSFHMNIGETDELDALRRHAGTMAIYHLSDSNRGGVGAGKIDFEAHHRVLTEAGYSGALVAEVVLPGNPVNTPPRDPEERAELQRHLRQSVRAWRGFGA
ncbi:MAG: hypothetical protein CMN30_28405 [Sandaracinus sp.]|nr:hypothetical protein [Sandaracinus sp.]|tara:strand:- start:2204 stop:3148 length:945 start_codon:yes stop_codon:yes gene_type:complete